jgi:thioesterase domain-containing protein
VGWDQASVPFTRPADMAAHNVAEMRKIQPHGPYYIGGYSFGGRIAIYMANQLSAAGEEVALLAIFDTVSHAGKQILPLRKWLKKLGSPKGLKKLKAARRHLWTRWAGVYRNIRYRALRPVLFPILEYYRSSGRPLPLFLCRPDRANHLMALELRHMPGYQGDAIYFKAEINPISIGHPDQQDSWDRIIKGNLTYIPTSGTHKHIMSKAHAPSLARDLSQELERARGGGAPTSDSGTRIVQAPSLARQTPQPSPPDLL